MMSSAEVIKKIRITMSLEQKEFAELLGLTTGAISHYECGLRKPRFPIIRRMKELAKKHGLKFTTDDFLGD